MYISTLNTIYNIRLYLNIFYNFNKIYLLKICNESKVMNYILFLFLLFNVNALMYAYCGSEYKYHLIVLMKNTLFISIYIYS